MCHDNTIHPSGTHRPYRPSNGTEGEIFVAEWCANCELANFDDPENCCTINLRAMMHRITDPEYPAEWQYSNGGVPQCTAFVCDGAPEPRCDRTLDMFDMSDALNKGQV